MFFASGNCKAFGGRVFFVIVPLLDNIVAIIGERIQTTAFNAEQALTKDTVPVNVDAIIPGTCTMRKRPHWR